MHLFQMDVLLSMLLLGVAAQDFNVVSHLPVVVSEGQPFAFFCRSGVVDWTLLRGASDQLVFGFHPPFGFSCMGPFESGQGQCVGRVTIDPIRRSPLTITSVTFDDAGVLQCRRRTRDGQYELRRWNVTVISGSPASLAYTVGDVSHNSDSTLSKLVANSSEIAFTCSTTFAGFEPALQLWRTDGPHSTTARNSTLLGASSSATDATFSSSATARISATYQVQPSDNEFTVSCRVKGVRTRTAPVQLFQRTDAVPLAASDADSAPADSSSPAWLSTWLSPSAFSQMKFKQYNWPWNDQHRLPGGDLAGSSDDASSAASSATSDEWVRTPSATPSTPLTASTDSDGTLLPRASSAADKVATPSLPVNLTLLLYNQEASSLSPRSVSQGDAFALAVWFVLGAMLILAVTVMALLLVRKPSPRTPPARLLAPSVDPCDADWPPAESSTRMLFNYNNDYLVPITTQGRGLVNSAFLLSDVTKAQPAQPTQYASSVSISEQQLPPESPGEPIYCEIPELIYRNISRSQSYPPQSPRAFESSEGIYENIPES